MAVALDDRDRALLSGEAGEGAALAMRLVVRAAEAPPARWSTRTIRSTARTSPGVWW